MLHTLEVRPTYIYTYSWQRSDGRTPSQRLRRFYKEHPGVVRFINFPLAHRWVQPEPEYVNGRRVNYYSYYSTPTEPFSAFDASVWDITTENFRHPLQTQIGRWGATTLSYVQHIFLAPFKKENERLLLSDVQLRLSATPEVSILLDWCLENANLKVGRDFDFSKEQQVIVKSDEFRLILAEKIGEWPEFDMTFTINHPQAMGWSVTIDDLKDSFPKT